MPEYLYQILLEKQVTPVEISSRITDSTLMSRFEVSSVRIDSLLFQSGYLTIVGGPLKTKGLGIKQKYLLDFPNLEVRHSLNEGFFSHLRDVGLIDQGVDLEREGNGLIQCLVVGEFYKFKEELSLLLKRVPHPWYDSSKNLSRLECWYASVVYWSFVALGLAPRVEEISHLGRCDMVVIYQDQVFVMEFKMLSGSNVQKSLEEGLAQIKSKDYAGPYKHQDTTIHLMSLVFDSQSRNISDILAETLK